MFKKRLVALVVGLALIVTAARAAMPLVVKPLAASAAPAGQVVACHASGSSGGGC